MSHGPDPFQNQIGMRFHPSDKEKITYLLHKANGCEGPLPCTEFVFIHTVDLFGSLAPWELFQKSWNGENHFFSRVKKVGQETCLDIGQGRWERIGQRSGIFDDVGLQVGFLDEYMFRSTRRADQDGKWRLKQYSLYNLAFAVCVKDGYADYRFCTVTNIDEGYVPDEDEGNQLHDIEGFFQEMLMKNLEGCSSSVDSNDSLSDT